MLYDYVANSILSVAEARDRTLSFFREVDFMRWFPAAFLANGAFIVIRGGIELTTPAL